MNVIKVEGGFRASFGGKWLPTTYKTKEAAYKALGKLKRKKRGGR